MKLPSPAPGKFTDSTIDLVNIGKVRLGQMLAENNETQLYYTDHPGVLVKMFDLGGGKADEVNYGTFMSFSLELANFEDVLKINDLRPFVPAYYGAHIDYHKKQAFIAMEYLAGQDLKSWCLEAAEKGYQSEWLDEFRCAVYEALSIIRLFHKHGIILIDFKPDNIIRLKDKAIKFVDLGAMFTPRYRQEMQTYTYSATLDHAEVMIDASNLQTGVAPTEASDVFSAGVALFEMATGTSRLGIEGHTADEILGIPAIYLFRDSQIRDVWRLYPHLKDVLPLLQTQLKERRLLFSDVWHLLKAYIAEKVPDWESLDHQQQGQIILATGTTFIMEQVPARLAWLAGPIAQATVLRNLRIKNMAELLKLLAHLAPDHVREDIEQHNCFIEYLRALEQPIEFVGNLNTWETRYDRKSGHWAIAASVGYGQLSDSAPYTFLKQTHGDEEGHRYLHVVDELEADESEGRKLTLWQVSNDHFAWLGA
jgi:serine/threonine protein kinase